MKEYIIKDDPPYNGNRTAAFKGHRWWCWLRSPGRNNLKAVYIHGDGNIGIQGNNIFLCNISVSYTHLTDHAEPGEDLSAGSD